MVEFALALPVLLLVVYGLIETGRLVFIYASVVTAARQAARYGSASGSIGSGSTLYYQDCSGIRTAAKQVGFINRFNDSDITIHYDLGPGTAQVVTDQPGSGGTGCPIATLSDNSHRILVTVSTQFSPIVGLLPFRAFTISSSANRTILTGVPITVDQGSVSGGGSGGGQIQLTKLANVSTYSAAGEVITYTYVIVNPGTDDIGTISIDDHVVDPGGNMNVPVDCTGHRDPLPGGGGAGSTTYCYATWTVTADEANAARAITNSATVRAFTTSGAVVTASASVTVNFAPKPKLTLVKDGDDTDPVISAGSIVHYTFTLTNSGNVNLTQPYTISDSKIGTNWTCASANTGTPTLAPGASVQCTGTYTLKNADINAAGVDNTATATAKFNTTTVTSNPSTKHVDTPKLQVTVTTNRDNPVTPITSVGDTVIYTYTLRNRTSSAMSNLKITDTRGASNFACLGSLASGATASCTSTRTYTVTQADIDGSLFLINTATASAQGGSISSNSAGSSVPISQTASISLTKTVPAPGMYSAGGNYTYGYLIRNTGNVTLTASATTPFTVTDDDPRFKSAICTLTAGSLAPNSAGTVNCTSPGFALTADDIAAGSLLSTATATATFGASTPTATSAVPFIVYSAPRLVLQYSPSPLVYTQAGNVITYTYGLINTGGYALTISSPYTLTDSLSGTITCNAGGSPANLDMGKTLSCGTKSYPVTAADITATSINTTLSYASGTAARADSPSTLAPNPASVPAKVSYAICDPTKLVSGGAIADQNSNVAWTFQNNTGNTLHISSMSISWSGPVTLQAVILTNTLGTSSLPPLNSAAIFTSPTVNWPVATNNTLSLKFSGSSVSSIKVTLAFWDSSCSFQSSP